ncbi:HAD family hydrolase [Nocardia sp. NPDC051929]|uniref:HAD family hydrolase n=1 Tax=Nocardia sp. NPDC051929 TaxID=3364327 RepID=UPI0037C72894
MNASPVLRAVLWDLDGTLLDTEKSWLDAVAEYIAVRVGAPPADDYVRLVGSTVSEVLHAMVAACGIQATGHNLRAAEQWINQRLVEVYTYPVPWRPGALAALRNTRAAGLRSALVTNTPRTLANIAIHAIGLDYFDASVCGGDVTNGKPAPEPYIRAAELLGVQTDQCVAIEDSPTGAAAAAAAGCGVIVVPCDLPLTTTTPGMIRDSLNSLTISDLQHALDRRGIRSPQLTATPPYSRSDYQAQ